MRNVLAMIGAATVIVGFAISLQGSGSCPTNQPECDHTFPGTNIWIGATSMTVIVAGLSLLIAAAAVAVYARTRQVEGLN